MSIFNSYQKVLLTISLMIFSLGCTKLSAQQAVSSAGGDGTGIGSFSYSIGIVVYTAAESTVDDASFIQGVQIPFEAYEIGSCATDFNGDGTTNGLDFVIFLGNFGIDCTSPPCPTDINIDGVTNGVDFTFFLGNFGVPCN